MPSKYQEMLKTQRQNQETARAGLMWEHGEEDRLMNMLFSGSSYESVAKDLKRTEGSIKTRLHSILCKQIDAGDETVESVYDKYKVSQEELDDFRDKKRKREEKLQERLKNRKPKTNPAPTRADNSNNVLSHILDIKRDLTSIKQYFKIN